MHRKAWGYSGKITPDPPNSAGKSLSLGSPSFSRQDRLRIVDVDACSELQSGNRRGMNVKNQAPKRVIGHDMATAVRAVLPAAPVRLHKAGKRSLAPFVTLTFSGFHKVKALTGAVPTTIGKNCSGSNPSLRERPGLRLSTAPQKHPPLCVLIAAYPLLAVHRERGLEYQ